MLKSLKLKRSERSWKNVKRAIFQLHTFELHIGALSVTIFIIFSKVLVHDSYTDGSICCETRERDT